MLWGIHRFAVVEPELARQSGIGAPGYGGQTL